MTENYKLYSLQAIGCAALLGSPLPAGILLRRNYLNLGRPFAANVALGVGILATVLLIAGVIAIPEPVLDRIPNMLIPFFVAGIVSLVVYRVHGKELEQHKAAGNLFYSLWRSSAIALSFCAVLFGALFAYFFLAPDSWDTEAYQKNLEQFQKNEKEALAVYNMLETNQMGNNLSFIRSTGIPKWKENEAIVLNTMKMDGLPQELNEEMVALLEYVRLRIESYENLALFMETDDPKYGENFDRIDQKIGEMLTLSEQKK